MVDSAQLALQKTLAKLRSDKARLEAQIKAIEHALTAFGVKSPRLAARRKRRPMSAAERRSVSRRMKAYWAKKRSAKAA
jgi:hypothetical protein